MNCGYPWHRVAMVQSGLILFEEKYVLGQWDSVPNTRQRCSARSAHWYGKVT